MQYIGVFSDLIIDRFTSVGAFLTDNEDFEVLLPNKYLTSDLETGQEIRVFIYNDSEDRPVATTEIPIVALNQFAYLKVKSVSNYGAFLDWGLEKDLLVPFSEQTVKMIEGNYYLIYLFLDEKTNRLVGSAKLNKFLNKNTRNLQIGDSVKLLIGEETDLGFKVIVNNEFPGLVYRDRVVKSLKSGDQTEGYIEFIRNDGKLDISFVPVGIEKFDMFSENLLNYIKAHNGKISLHDKTDSEIIKKELGMSKKSFKKAVGNLYRNKIIEITDNGLSLL